MRDLDGPGFTGHQGRRMQRHDGNRGGGTIDRFEGGRMLFLGGDHDLARHGFISDYRSGRSAVLAVDDSKFAALDRGDDNRRLKDGVDGEVAPLFRSLSSIGRKHEFFETAKGSVIIARSGSILEPKDRGRLQ
jgi:hypothetical protein